jgi:NADH-quinone oxidoreductase subunit L
MTIPLVILAVLAALGGLLNLPFGGTPLEHWLEPVFGHNLREVASSGGAKLVLATLAFVTAVLGGMVAATIYRRHRIAEEKVEPRILQRAWMVDELYQKTIAHPGRALSQWLASVFDAKVIDGAVNGVAGLVRAGGSRLRLVQTGFVRSYALAVALGAVGILAFALVRSL